MTFSLVTACCITRAEVLVLTDDLSIKRSESESRIVVSSCVVDGISTMTSPLTTQQLKVAAGLGWQHSHSLSLFFYFFYFFFLFFFLLLHSSSASKNCADSRKFRRGATHGCCQIYCKSCTVTFIETSVPSEYIVPLHR